MSSVTNQRLIISRANHFVRRPFVRAPHREVGGTLHQHGLFTEKVNKVKEIRTKVSLKQNDPVLDNLGFPVLVPDLDLKNVHPVIKSIFQGSVIQQFPLAGRLKNFQRAWEKLTKDQEILSIIKGYQIPFITNPIQNSVRNVQMKKEQKVLVDKEVSDILRKGAIRLCQNQPTKPLSKYSVLSREKGRRVSPSDKSKTVKQVYTFPTFQNGRFALPEIHAKRGGLHVQARYERCILFSSSESDIQRESAFSVVREIIRVSLPMFWLRSCTSHFYKDFEGPDVLTKEIKYFNYNLSGRHVTFGKNQGRDCTGKRYSHLPITTLRLCNKPEEVGFRAHTEDRILRSDSEFSGSLLVFNSRETSESKDTLLEMYKAETVSILELTKLIGLLCSCLLYTSPSPRDS